MAAFLIYSGLTNTPTAVNGIHRFFQYETAANNYSTDSTHLIIDTPNFPTLVGNGYATNGNLCGSGLTQASENTAARGPAFAVNVSVPGGASSWPASAPTFQMGGVDWPTYTAGGKTADDFATDIQEGAKQFDGLDGAPNQSIHPGNVKDDNITVILPSQYYLGQKGGASGLNENGRRIHYKVNRLSNNLAILLAKIWRGDIGKMTAGSVGPGILASYTNEQAASVWLSNGYGLEYLGAPEYATY
tara:strand:+ start:40 stop:774 length:735 start_codon:yes stop_codon:yes gene_type:complete